MLALELTSDRSDIQSMLADIVALGDEDKEALGFLPPSAFQDACLQERLVAAYQTRSSEKHLVGYVLFGGMFPHARIYQIAVSRTFRRSGVASKLIDRLAARLEADGYISLTARVAHDLSEATAFYERCGFVHARTVAGGASRARQLSILARTLRSDDLFSTSTNVAQSDRMLALTFRASRPGDAPFYTFDLNVLFDLLRNRQRTASARRLFGAALAHRIRLAVSPEFITELRRTSLAAADDTVLQMALQLPQLVPAADAELNDVATKVHRIVFEDTRSRQAGLPQSRSDARHVAHAAIARASAYITSDGAILQQKARLRAEVGIDIADLEELAELIADDPPRPGSLHTRGEGFEVLDLDRGRAEDYFSQTGELRSLLPQIRGDALAAPRRLAVQRDGEIVAVCVLVPPSVPGASSKLILHPNPRWLDGARFLDALFDRVVTEVTASGPVSIEFLPIRDESFSLVTSFVQSRGFLRASPQEPFFKVALGRALTPEKWDEAAELLRRRTGFALLPLISNSDNASIELTGRGLLSIPYPRLEDILSPTIVAWPGRSAVIQPIASNYAHELLGSSRQPSLLESRTASFLSRRTYVSSPRSARLMSPGSMIFFYESQRTGGVGGVVAVARIVDSLITSKHSLPRKELDHVVVDDVAALTKADEVLLTSFDNVLVLPRPVLLHELRELNAVGTQNLQSTTEVFFESAASILDAGWKRDA